MPFSPDVLLLYRAENQTQLLPDASRPFISPATTVAETETLSPATTVTRRTSSTFLKFGNASASCLGLLSVALSANLDLFSG